MAVIAVEPEIGLVLKEIAPQTSLEEVRKATTAQLMVSDSLTVMEVQLSSASE
jgi:acyl CoA:acetate/3-ketoacid CoA transferase beta subunit